MSSTYAYEKYLVENGLANTRAEGIAKVIELLHIQVGALDQNNRQALRRLYPDLMQAVATFGALGAGLNTYQDDIEGN